MAKTTSKIKTKKVSNQIQNKTKVIKLVKEFLQNQGYEIVDCNETPIEGVTKYTLFARDPEKADVRINFISKPDKKSPFYSVVDEALEQDLCNDEE